MAIKLKKPIQLYVPKYLDTQEITGQALKLFKTKPLMAGDANNVVFYASLETIENYQCTIADIDETFQKIATNCFYRDMEKGYELPVTVSDSKVYTYYYTGGENHFRIYWILISDAIMLQLASVFGPQHTNYYKYYFTSLLQKTQINKNIDYQIYMENQESVFDVEFESVETDSLEELIVSAREASEKAHFLQDNLKLSNPNFFELLKKELAIESEIEIDNFICTSWNLYFCLGNPENFEDPDNLPAWSLPSSQLYNYYETPYTNPAKVMLYASGDLVKVDPLKNLLKNKDTIENNLLDAMEKYTFGGGGAYAGAKHFEFAKKTIERDLQKTYTVKSFLKHNLCLQSIELDRNGKALRLHFKCSWDEEHGIMATIVATKIVSIE